MRDLEKLATMVLITLALPTAVGKAQSYSDTERVTAIDLSVELRSTTQRSDSVRKPPGNLSASDFQILVDGRPQPLVALAPVTATIDHPYRILIYVDPDLINSRELQGSIDLLTSRTRELTDMAAVDLVIADPEPRFVLRDSRNPELLENLLASTHLKEEAGDRIRALRAGFIESLVDSDSDIGLQDSVDAFVVEEQRLVQERLDLLLSFLADREVSEQQKVLLLIGVQFDVDPSAFYSSWSEGPTKAPEAPQAAAGPLDASSRSLAAMIAAYGWITFPVAAPPEESPLVPGLRIGKWRLAGPAGGRILGVRIARESERDPELAQAHLEKGRALLASGKAEESEEAFRLALHHFYGDPRTKDQQAEALVGLAEAVKQQGEEDEARSMLALASEMDASVSTDDPTALASLLDPTEVLEILAFETSGRVLHEEIDLEVALLGLQHRQRLTLQLPGSPRGEMYSVEARTSRDGWVVRSPLWIRFGTPPGVPVARARLLVSGDVVEPTLVLDARVERRSVASDLAMAEFRLPIATDAADPPPEDGYDCRVTAAWVAGDEILRVDQRLPSCSPGDEGLSGTFEISLDSELVALVVEHLASGAWGAEIFEIEVPAGDME